MKIFACLILFAALLAGCEPVERPNTENMSHEESSLALARYYLDLRLDGSGITITDISLNPHNQNQALVKLSNNHAMVLNLRRDGQGKVFEVARTDHATGAPVSVNPFELKNRAISAAIPCGSAEQLRQINADAAAFLTATAKNINIYDVASNKYAIYPIVEITEMPKLKFADDTPQVVFYAAEVDIAKAGDYAVAIYFGGEIELFANGEKVLAVQSDQRVRQVHLIPLKEGRNRIVSRTLATNDWAFSIKVVDGPVIVK